MSDENLHVLTNSFLAVRLLALREVPPTEDQGSGPFLVVQRALDPELPGVEPTDFLLTREGTWLPLNSFAGLGWDEVRDLAFFPSAAEVILLLEKLPTRPVVERRGAAEGTDPEPGDEREEAFYAAVLRAVRG